MLARVNFDFSSRRPFYATIRAFNHAGLKSRVTSQPIYVIARSNNVGSLVTDGNSANRDIDYQNTTTYLSGHVRFGVNCPMRSVEWAIENIDGNLVLNFTSVEPNAVGGVTNNQYFVSTDHVRLNDDEAYRIVVRGVDYSGRLHLLKSNGTSVTTKPLVPGSVEDGPVPNLDLSFQESVSTLSAHWSGFGEDSPEQAVAFYEIAAGSNHQHPSTRSDIFPFTAIGRITSYTITGLQLQMMAQYFITVRAHGVSGSVAEATSNGIRVGYGHMITPGNITVPLFQSDTSSITVRWSEFESDLPLISYELALGSRNLSTLQNLQTFCNDITSTYGGDFEVSGFQNIGLDTVATKSGITLQHAVSYFATLRVIDQAKRCLIYTSPVATMIDTTPPLGHMTTIGPAESRIGLGNNTQYIAYSRAEDKLSLLWEPFSDPESPIDSYKVGFFELQNCSSGFEEFVIGSPVMNYTSVGMATTFMFERLGLDRNKAYVASVQGSNQAGLTTTILTQPVILDTQTLTAGNIRDGTSWGRDLVFQSDRTSLSATFSHAVFQPLSLSGNLSDTACPNNSFFSLRSNHSQWSTFLPVTLDGLSTSIQYVSSQTSLSTSPPGRKITVAYNPPTSTMISAAYQTVVPSLQGEGTVSFTIRAAVGDPELQAAAITSVVFIDSPGRPGLLADLDLTGNAFSDPDAFKAFGFQIHHSYSNGSQFSQQKVILWSKDNSQLSQTQHVTQNLTHDLSVPHKYELVFSNEQLGLTFVRKVVLYIDGVIQAILSGLPDFSPETRMVLHAFERGGFVPQCDSTCVTNPPSVSAVFSDISFPALAIDGGEVCVHGNPFHSWTSPIVEFRAAVGTQPGLTDVKGFEVCMSICLSILLLIKLTI